MNSRIFSYFPEHTPGDFSFLLIAGPCVIEDEDSPLKIAEYLKELTQKLNIPLVFKASYKKANRSKLSSFTGIGDKKALKVLSKIREEFQVPVITDIHETNEAEMAAEYVDALQIPAFLARQTALLLAAGKTGKVVNIKKGQFMSAEAMQYAAEKVLATGNSKILLTERGTFFGYSDLVVDFRNIPLMKKTGFPVVLDCTHSVQKPNQTTGVSGGNPEFIETLALAGAVLDTEAFFIETHPEPSQAKSDGTNMLKLELLEKLLQKLLLVKQTLRNFR